MDWIKEKGYMQKKRHERKRQKKGIIAKR